MSKLFKKRKENVKPQSLFQSNRTVSWGDEFMKESGFIGDDEEEISSDDSNNYKVDFLRSPYRKGWQPSTEHRCKRRIISWRTSFGTWFGKCHQWWRCPFRKLGFIDIQLFGQRLRLCNWEEWCQRARLPSRWYWRNPSRWQRCRWCYWVTKLLGHHRNEQKSLRECWELFVERIKGSEASKPPIWRSTKTSTHSERLPAK